MSKPFQFKQFTIEQDRCAMKIGTDGVLLGAWTDLKFSPFSILDIGAGTGIIALQMAQRSDAEIIDAIEIDEDAYEQCVENFENSPWSDRLFCYHASLDEFAEEIDDEYDLIISNPPFFTEKSTSPDSSRSLARFSDSLPFEDLLDGVSKLLSEKGVFAVVIPRKEEEFFIELASAKGLFPRRICRIQGNKTSGEKRSALEFTFSETTPLLENLTIENSRHDYTPEYKELVKEFYLRM